MPDEHQNHYKEFIREMDALEAFMKLVQGAQSDVASLREKAEKDIKEYVWNHLTDDMRERFATMENVDPEEHQRVLQHDAESLKSSPATRFYTQLDALVEGIGEKTLEALVAAPDIRARVQKEDVAVVQTYRSYREFDAFVTRYLESGQTMTKEEENILVNAALLGYAKSEEDKVEGEKEKKFVRALAIAAAKSNFSRRHQDKKAAEFVQKDAKAGLEEQANKLKKVYEEQAQKTGRNIHGAMRAALKSTKSLAEESPKEFAKVYSALYAAEKGKLKYEPLHIGGEGEE